MASEMKADNIHKDHRKRVKNRFKAEGLGSFSDHQILELLLFYSIPRKDTNEIAHKLLAEFGSLSGVFDASAEDLERCTGITENSALLIKLIPQIARAYQLDRKIGNTSFADLDKLGDYLTSYFVGAVCEKAVLLMFNNNMELIDCVEIAEGTIGSVNFPTRIVTDHCIRRNAACFIIAHNHPSGSIEPSEDDIALTRDLLPAFRTLGIPMLEHIIVANGRYNPIVRTCGLK